MSREPHITPSMKRLSEMSVCGSLRPLSNLKLEKSVASASLKPEKQETQDMKEVSFIEHMTDTLYHGKTSDTLTDLSVNLCIITGGG